MGKLNAKEEEQEKDPGKAFVLSLLIPGSGQLYNKKYVKAAVYVGIDMYMFYNAYDKQITYKTTDDLLYRDERNKYIWWGLGTWLLGAIDAYVDAHLSLFPSENLKLETQSGYLSGLQLTLYF